MSELRATDEDVKAVLEQGAIDIITDNDIALQPFLETANPIVDYIDSQDTANILAVGVLKQMEIYLAAHFYHHRDQPLQTKSTGAASGTFQGQFGMGFDSTRWGQTAKRLDFTGTLAALDEPKARKAGIKWLGTAADSLRPDTQV